MMGDKKARKIEIFRASCLVRAVCSIALLLQGIDMSPYKFQVL